MKRVAALYLPQWPIERLRRAEPEAAPPEASAPEPRARNGGWRPGARWARDERTLPAIGARDADGAMVTSLHDANRLIVGAACPRARALGIVPGMALSQARVQVRGLDIRPADPEGDLAALHALAIRAAQGWSPTVAVEGDDCLFIDLTGTAHLFGGEACFARRAIRLLARYGFTAQIAVADTPGAAWALARFALPRHPRESGGCTRPPCAPRMAKIAGGNLTCASPAPSTSRRVQEMGARYRGHDSIMVCPPGEHGEAIAPLPVAALRAETRHVELLSRLGIDRIGQLAGIPRGPLVKRFGAGLARLLLQARGDLPEPLHPVVPEQPIAVALRFAEPIASPEAIAHWLGVLVPQLATALEAEGLGALRLELIADRIDGIPQRIRIGLARPNRDPAHLLRLLTRRIEEVEPGYGIDAIALHIRRAGLLGPEPVVERLDEEAAPDLAPLVDTLATRIGLPRMWRMRPVESEVPERAARRAPVLDPPERSGLRRKIDDVTQLDRNPALMPWHPDWPRPARLLNRPELLDHVIAELPDQAPRRFTWRGRPHRVIRADGPERIHGEWWKRSAERDSIRDYFRVEDETGHRYWLFRRGDGERAATGDLSWYLHGVFG